MAISHRLHSSMYERPDEGADQKPKRIVFLSVEGNTTEKDYFRFVNKYRDQLSVQSVIHIEILSRWSSDTLSNPDQVLGLLHELKKLQDNGIHPVELCDVLGSEYTMDDITQYCGAAVTLVAEYPAQGFLHRDTIRAHAATSLEHDAVDYLILKRMIDLPHDRPVLYQRVNPQHQRRHPFPVAVVSQQQCNGLAAVENFGHLLAALEGHAAHDVLVTDRRVLHRLDQDVTEVAVELHPQLLEFLVALVRISVTQVLADHAVAVAQHVGDHHKHDGAEHVVKPQRHHRQPVPRAIYQPKRYIVDYPFHYRLRKYNIFR